jgi:hypothetical protein
MNAICDRWEDVKDVPQSGTFAIPMVRERYVEHICAELEKDPSIICTDNVAEVSTPAACFTFSLKTLEVKGL